METETQSNVAQISQDIGRRISCSRLWFCCHRNTGGRKTLKAVMDAGVGLNCWACLRFILPKGPVVQWEHCGRISNPSATSFVLEGLQGTLCCWPWMWVWIWVWIWIWVWVSIQIWVWVWVCTQVLIGASSVVGWEQVSCFPYGTPEREQLLCRGDPRGFVPDSILPISGNVHIASKQHGLFEVSPF